jgi:hypothetical protein
MTKQNYTHGPTLKKSRASKLALPFLIFGVLMIGGGAAGYFYPPFANGNGIIFAVSKFVVTVAPPTIMVIGGCAMLCAYGVAQYMRDKSIRRRKSDDIIIEPVRHKVSIDELDDAELKWLDERYAEWKQASISVDKNVVEAEIVDRERR